MFHQRTRFFKVRSQGRLHGCGILNVAWCVFQKSPVIDEVFQAQLFRSSLIFQHRVVFEDSTCLPLDLNDIWGSDSTFSSKRARISGVLLFLSSPYFYTVTFLNFFYFVENTSGKVTSFIEENWSNTDTKRSTFSLGLSSIINSLRYPIEDKHSYKEDTCKKICWQYYVSLQSKNRFRFAYFFRDVMESFYLKS